MVNPKSFSFSTYPLPILLFPFSLPISSLIVYTAYLVIVTNDQGLLFGDELTGFVLLFTMAIPLVLVLGK